MVTGSNSLTSDIQPTLLVSADKQETGFTSNHHSVCQVERSAVTISNFSEDLVNLIDLKVYRFPYAVNDENWVNQVDNVLGSVNIPNPLFLIEPCAFMMVPEVLYQEKQIESCFQVQGTDLIGKSISEYRNHNSDHRIISLYPTGLNEILSGGKILIDLCPVTESLRAESKGKIHVIVRDEKVDVVLFEKEVVLLNRFNADHENDILYFCVAALEQAGLQIDDVIINISGNAEKLNSLHELFAKYFKKLQKLPTPKKIQVPYGFKEVDPAICWPTLNAHLCV